MKPASRPRAVPAALRVLLAAALVVCATSASRAAAAPAPPPPQPPAPVNAPAQPAPAASAPSASVDPSSWVGQLESLGRWLEQRRAEPRCAERCFALQRMRLTGSVRERAFRFELDGSVMADGAVAVPLFGPASSARLTDVKEDGRPAVVGFEKDHYYLFTASRHFSLRGAIALRGDQALSIPGPLNAFDADLSDGSVVEGARLSGLSATTIHFNAAEAAPSAAEPTVFQLSRAVRVAREIGFEYRLVMRSGADLGVARLPLAFGEHVLEVTGANGWKLEGAELVLPTAGRSAQITITGTLSAVRAFSPDSRSAYEWWLLESDPEHRVVVTGDARQVDAAESPIPKTQAGARLYLLRRGQRFEVAVQALASTEVLAAVVRQHRRTAVVTRRGDLVSDDTLEYENNGIDFLAYAPGGRPIFLSTDDKAERIMRQDKGGDEVLVPLRTGSHRVRVQALSEVALGRLGGWVELPMPGYALTASGLELTVGFPVHAVPLAATGGDRVHAAVGVGDAVALALAAATAWIAFRGRRRRLLGAIALGGAWLVSGPLFVAALCAFGVAGLVWLASRFYSGPKLVAVVGVAVAAGGLAAIVLLAAAATMRAGGPSSGSPSYRAEERAASAAGPSADVDARDKTAGVGAGEKTVGGGLLHGVTPVALGLPTYEHSVHLRRELVTRERPFRPRLLYVTAWVLWPLGIGWLGCVAALVWAHRDGLKRLRDRVRERLDRKPVEQGPAAGPAA
jgi:hypothetical protein